MASHQLAKFLDHRHCGSRDVMILVRLVISKGYVIEGSCNFMAGAPCQAWWPQAL